MRCILLNGIDIFINKGQDDNGVWQGFSDEIKFEHGGENALAYSVEFFDFDGDGIDNHLMMSRDNYTNLLYKDFDYTASSLNSIEFGFGYGKFENVEEDKQEDNTRAAKNL